MTTIDEKTPAANGTSSGGFADLNAKVQPNIEKAKAFAKSRPWAVGALAAIVGLATINTLRGKN